MDYELALVTNQDGLGTSSFPEETFWPAHNKMLQAFANEGITFSDVLIDRSFPHDNAATRKPQTGLLTAYLHGRYNLAGSIVIGYRSTYVELAKNLGCRSIRLGDTPDPDADLTTEHWAEIRPSSKASTAGQR